MMGAEDQIITDPQAALAAYQRAVPRAFTTLIQGVGHSPNVEEPNLTSELVLGSPDRRNPGPSPKTSSGCKNECRIRKASGGHPRLRTHVRDEPTPAARLTDAVDLIIDFATLGEYGLEPVGPAPALARAGRGGRYAAPVPGTPR